MNIVDAISSDQIVWLMDSVVNYAYGITYVAVGMKFTAQENSQQVLNMKAVDTAVLRFTATDKQTLYKNAAEIQEFESTMVTP